MNFMILVRGQLLYVFLFFSFSLFAQDVVYSDSLKSAIKRMPPAEQTHALWTLAREYASKDSIKTTEIIREIENAESDVNKAKAMKLAIRAGLYDAANMVLLAKSNYKQAAQQLSMLNERQKSAQVLSDLASLYGIQSDFDSLKFYAGESAALFLQMHDTLGLAASYTNMGRAYQLMGQYDSAIVHLFRALAFVENHKPSPLLQKIHLRSVGNTYNNLGITYMEQGDLTNAMKFYRKASDKKKELGDFTEVGNIMINLGGIKFEEGDPIAARAYLDTASMYYGKTNHSMGLLMCQNNSAAVSNMVGEYAKAISYAIQSVSLAKKLNDLNNQALGYIHLGTAHWRLSKEKSGDLFLDSAYATGRAIGSKNIVNEVQNLRYEFALEQKDFEKALRYRNEYMATQDSMFQVQKSREISELETKYKTTEKEQEIVYLNQQTELQEAKLARNTFLMLGMLFLIIVLVLLFVLWRARTQARHRTALQEQKILIRENQIKAVIASQEQERKRFAKDLHDGMGQLFSALQLNIKALKTPEKDLSSRDALFENSTQLLNDIHTEIRNIAFNLMPQTLLHSGLKEALEELTARINRTDQITVQLSVFDLNERLPEIIEVSLYRITQEFLSNIMKYSQAKNVFLNLTMHDDELVYTIEDNGKGYDLDVFKNNEGNGWRNINSRISLIKGSIEIETHPGSHGSTVIIQLPTTAIAHIATNQMTAEV